VKRAALLALMVLGGSCKQQDAALMITMFGPFGIPQNADRLRIEVFDDPGAGLILGQDWCATSTDTCGFLPPGSLTATVTIVETGSHHPTVRVDATLMLGQGTAVVGKGTVFAAFTEGQTVQIQIPVSRPQ
jgi:hypothetical protein